MNKENFWQGFMEQDIAVFAETQEQYDSFMQYCYFVGLRWANGSIAVDQRKIKKDGIYIMGTREKELPYVLNSAERGESFLKRLKIVSVNYVLKELLYDDINLIEQKLGYTMKYLFDYVYGHIIYSYDPDTDMIWDLCASGIKQKKGNYYISTGLDDVPLAELNKSWFLSEQAALECQ